jgi:predicted NAD/FAD-binding protein
MNILQCLPDDAPNFCVTLNKTQEIDPGKILRTFNYSHPVFSREMVAAQQRRSEICGVDGLHFCGAYWYNGFHEDGVRSALDVCKRFEDKA